MKRSRQAGDARTIARSLVRTGANAVQAGRLATASAAVIGRRVALGQAAMLDPASADHREFVRMTAEKGVAMVQAATAGMRRQPALGALVGRFAAAEATAAWHAGLRLATAPSPAAFVQAQWQYAGEALARSWSLYLSLGQATAQAAGAMTAPVLRTAAANARRLG